MHTDFRFVPNPGARWRSGCVACLLILGSAGVIRGAEVPAFDYVARLGFQDARHSQDGFQLSGLLDFSPSGFSLGVSRLYVGAPNTRNESLAGQEAQTAWVGSPQGATTRIGLYAGIYTRDDGRQENYPLEVNAGGVTIGYATRWVGHAEAGTSAWIADRHGVTLQVGVYDADHTRTGGRKISRPVDLNAANRVVGYSLGSHADASTAWVATSTGRIDRIGLFDAAHTSSAGVRESVPFGITDSGYIAGVSRLFGPTTERLYTPWVRKPWGAMRLVGFQTGVYRSSAGLHGGAVTHLTNTGYVAGQSLYFDGASTSQGYVAWVTHVEGPNRRVGFYDAAHITRGSVEDLNDNGYAIGTSPQIVSPGNTAWIATPQGQTIRVGLYTGDYTNGSLQINYAVGLGESNDAIGIARRVAFGLGSENQDGWVANPTGQTTRLGLIDATHALPNGRRMTTLGGLTGSRYVWGATVRAAGGQTGWIYDRTTQSYQTFVLETSSTGEAYSAIDDVQDDGTAVGHYHRFTSAGALIGVQAFVFVPGAGTSDLDDLVVEDPAALGWANLSLVNFLVPGTFVAGTGPRLTGSSVAQPQGVFLLRREP